VARDTSFSYSFLVLPDDQRQAIGIVWDFCRAVDDAVQLIGGQGVLADHPVDRLYRAVRALRIYEGTTEIQQLIIAGELLK